VADPVGTTAADAGKVALSAGSAAATTLLAAAGAASTIPVGGWIAAAVLAVIAGATAAVSARVNAAQRQAEAQSWAVEAGIPDPQTRPALMVALQGQTRTQMVETLRTLIRQHGQERNAARKRDLWERIQQTRAAFAARFGR
jgi:hypothetical protein